MGLQFYFFNFGQFGGFFFLKMASLGVFGFDLVNMPSFQFLKKNQECSILFFSFWGSSFYFFYGGDGIFKFHFVLLCCLPCDGFGH